MPESLRCEVAVIGGGSGGFGAALAAARQGLDVLLVEPGPILGGTSTLGGVNCWEMGVGGTGIPYDVYRRLTRVPDAAGIYSMGRHFSYQAGWHWPHRLGKVIFPGGENLSDPSQRYLDTLRRHPGPGDVRGEAFCRRTWHGVCFEPRAMDEVMRDMLDETGSCRLKLGVEFVRAECGGGHVRRAWLSDGTAIEADHWVDATGDGLLCLACGCEALCGQDSQERFGEPGAPAQPTAIVNGATLMYRIARRAHPAVDPLPDGVPADCWWAPCFPPVCCDQYPCGDRSMNMLPAMEGRECLERGRPAATAECRRRALAHWHFLQSHFPEFRRFGLASFAPMLGVRESNRIVCEHMLSEHDILAGIGGQDAADIVALADHALDRHGEQGACPEVAQPYGIPYRCLIPRGFRNLLVACRAAGFSAIAATSVRLSRTLMQLGQAAGTACALARELKVELPEVPASDLRAGLRAQHVQLDWPMPDDLRAHLAAE